MKGSITNGLNEELVTILSREFVGSHHLRERLVDMLEREQDCIYLSMRSEDFDSANWENKHAYKLGEVKGLQKLITLLQ